MREGDIIKELRPGVTLNQFLNMRLLISNDYYEDIDQLAKEHNVHIIKITNVKLNKTKLESKGYYFKAMTTYNVRSVPTNFLESLKKEKRKRIKKLSEELQIELKPLTEEDYNSWLDLYEEGISKKDKGNFSATKEWFIQRNQDLNKQLYGLFATYEDQLVGGTILVISIFEGKRLLNSAFKTATQEWIKKGIFDFLAYNFIESANKLDCEIIRSGADTNFYGHHLSTGLFLFKRKWGFYPEPANKFEFIKIINDEIFSNPYFFFSGEKDRKIELFIKGDINISQIEKYSPFPINLHKI